ncbi:MAG: carboxymuconolactone decarboxylase family protein [Oligoflexia bacterium]|nr:carboxymuconolactone decarboxylase family protein [Oligoflexia bacterium]
MNFTSIPASPEATYAEVAQTFGRVPEFIRNIPPAGVSGAWGGLKVLAFNPHTAIPPKYKDLITLAVSAQIPCSYCVYFDTQTARLDGATEEEINEAIGMAAMSRHWSTVLNGMQIDSSRFRKQLTQAFAYIKKQSAPSPHNSQAKTRG